MNAHNHNELLTVCHACDEARRATGAPTTWGDLFALDALANVDAICKRARLNDTIASINAKWSAGAIQMGGELWGAK